MIPTPSQIFDRFERGEIEREELHALMAFHAHELIQEMEEDYQNPAAAWIESLKDYTLSFQELDGTDCRDLTWEKQPDGSNLFSEMKFTP